MTLPIQNDVLMKFNPTAARPVVPARPGIITINGKEFKVRVEMQVEGVWKEVDSSKFTEAELTALATRCQTIFAATKLYTGEPTSLTLYLTKTDLPESWKSTILGKFSDRFKDEPANLVNLTLKKIEYKTDGSDRTEVFDLEKEELEPKTQSAVLSEVKKTTLLASSIFSKAQLASQAKKIR